MPQVLSGEELSVSITCKFIDSPKLNANPFGVARNWAVKATTQHQDYRFTNTYSKTLLNQKSWQRLREQQLVVNLTRTTPFGMQVT